MHSSPRALIVPIMRCFNVAAICALAVWHGYAFQVNQAIAHVPQSHVLELQLIESNMAHLTQTQASTLSH
ncbi:hypothetical protein [Undibacterium sp. Ren11W]|uniref:hypothetical protein n=1 Tax=Undibacterium sp. Ren11W TaxID=3413045 RepID=UPI003BF21AF6